MEIVITGRNVEVPDHFREHIAEKVARLERYDDKIAGLEVELFHERNRRQLKSCQRIEITGRGGCGAVARAEACAQDFYAALDAAVAKLEARLRRSHDRRRVTGRRTRLLAGRGSGTAVLDESLTEELLSDGGPLIPTMRPTDDEAVDGPVGRDDGRDDRDNHGHPDDWEDDDLVPGRIVRRKVHQVHPMSIDDALSRMELVGHDFYLFADVESGAPSVVYRRKGYDYGVIRLSQ